MENSINEKSLLLSNNNVKCYSVGSKPHKKDSNDQDQIRIVRIKVLRIVIVLFSVFFTSYAASKPLVELQASINGTVGLYTLTAQIGINVVVAFLGTAIVKKLSPKYTLLLGCTIYTIFTLANFYPKWFVLVPAGLISGMASAPMWICFGTYCTSAGVEYARVTNQSKEAVLSRLNGCLGAAVPAAIIVGNFLSSAILDNVDTQDKKQTLNSSNVFANHQVNNYTILERGHKCGPQFCPDNIMIPPEKMSTDINALYILLGVLGGFNLLSISLVLFGLPNLAKHEYISDEDTDKNGQILTMSYFRALFDWRFILLTPFTAYIFVFMTLNVSLFTRAYIACTIGVSMIGYITVARGVSDLIMCTVLGFVGHCCHRNVILFVGFLSILGIIILLLLWNELSPSINATMLLFLISAISGVANSINMSQYYAFIGAVFTEKKMYAFSYLQIIISISGAFGYYSTIYLCAATQLYLLLSLMILGLICFIIFSIYLKLNEKVAESKQ